MEPLQSALGASKGAVVGAFSLALFASGLTAPLVGRAIDKHGGRWVMSAGSVLAGIGLWSLAYVSSLPQLYGVWALLGVAMGATLYDPAFAVLTQTFRANYRKAITALTLFGGFASSLFWPATAWLIETRGWQEAAMALGALQFIICLPLHAFALPRAAPSAEALVTDLSQSTSLHKVLRDGAFYLLCLAFAANVLVFSGMAVHMLSMLTTKGLSLVEAAWIGAMVGPMQVAGRVVELLFERHTKPSTVGLLAMAALPVSLGILLLAGDTVAAYVAFAFLYGAGNGVMTIVRGAIPVQLYGRAHYGAVSGAMAAPVFISKALGPLVAALIWGMLGGYGGVLISFMAFASVSVLFFPLAVGAHHSPTAQ